MFCNDIIKWREKNFINIPHTDEDFEIFLNSLDSDEIKLVENFEYDFIDYFKKYLEQKYRYFIFIEYFNSKYGKISLIKSMDDYNRLIGTDSKFITFGGGELLVYKNGIRYAIGIVSEQGLENFKKSVKDFNYSVSDWDDEDFEPIF